MCTAQTAKRRRRQMKLDKRYGGARKDASVRARRNAELIRKEKERQARMGQSNKSNKSNKK